MCDLADGFRLCTCDGEELVDPDWHLERRDDSLPEHHRIGRAIVPRYDEREREMLARVVAVLDDGGCFDFEYAPRRHDVLHLRVGQRTYRFRFEDDGWALDQSTSLTGWRAQMVQDRVGRLEQS